MVDVVEIADILDAREVDLLGGYEYEVDESVLERVFVVFERRRSRVLSSSCPDFCE